MICNVINISTLWFVMGVLLISAGSVDDGDPDS